MAKAKKKSYMLVLLVVLLLSIAIGYAALAQNLRIEGTANANGKFELVFQDASIGSSVGADDSTASISTDGRILSFNMNLKHPGAGGTILAKVKNTGDIDAKLNGMTFTGENDPDIAITPHGFVSGQVIKAGEYIDISIDVVWNQTSATAKTISFTGTLVYEQATDTFDSNNNG